MSIHYSFNVASKHRTHLYFWNWFLMLIYWCSLLPRYKFYHFRHWYDNPVLFLNAAQVQNWILFHHCFMNEDKPRNAHKCLDLRRSEEVRCSVLFCCLLLPETFQKSPKQQQFDFLFIYENVPYFTKFNIL